MTSPICDVKETRGALEVRMLATSFAYFVQAFHFDAQIEFIYLRIAHLLYIMKPRCAGFSSQIWYGWRLGLGIDTQASFKNIFYCLLTFSINRHNRLEFWRIKLVGKGPRFVEFEIMFELTCVSICEMYFWRHHLFFLSFHRRN